MLFNSYPFIFAFLPIALVGYFALGRSGKLAPFVWLALASIKESSTNWPDIKRRSNKNGTGILHMT